MIKVFLSEKVFASRFAKFGVVGVWCLVLLFLLLLLLLLLQHYVMPFEKCEKAKKKKFGV